MRKLTCQANDGHVEEVASEAVGRRKIMSPEMRAFDQKTHSHSGHLLNEETQSHPRSLAPAGNSKFACGEALLGLT